MCFCFLYGIQIISICIRDKEAYKGVTQKFNVLIAMCARITYIQPPLIEQKFVIYVLASTANSLYEVNLSPSTPSAI